MGKLKRWSDFLTGQDVENGAVVTIIGEPQLRPAEETGFNRDVYTVKILLPDGEEREWTLNKTTYNALFDSFGDESKNWVKRKVVIRKTQQNVRGTMRDVLYGTPYEEPQKGSEQVTMDQVLKDTEDWSEERRSAYIRYLRDTGKLGPPP